MMNMRSKPISSTTSSMLLKELSSSVSWRSKAMRTGIVMTLYRMMMPRRRSHVNLNFSNGWRGSIMPMRLNLGPSSSES